MGPYWQYLKLDLSEYAWIENAEEEGEMFCLWDH